MNSNDVFSFLHNIPPENVEDSDPNDIQMGLDSLVIRNDLL